MPKKSGISRKWSLILKILMIARAGGFDFEWHPTWREGGGGRWDIATFHFYRQ